MQRNGIEQIVHMRRSVTVHRRFTPVSASLFKGALPHSPLWERVLWGICLGFSESFGLSASLFFAVSWPDQALSKLGIRSSAPTFSEIEPQRPPDVRGAVDGRAIIHPRDPPPDVGVGPMPNGSCEREARDETRLR